MRPELKKNLLAMFVLLLLLAGSGLFWLGATESGLRWIYQQSGKFLPGELHISKLEGRLFGRITATDLVYQKADTRVALERVTLKWRPFELLTGNLVVSQLHVQSVTISLPAAQQSKAEQAVELPDIRLPVNVTLEDIRLDDIHIRRDAQQFALHQVTLDASSRGNKIHIDALDVSATEFDLHIDGTLKPVGDYQHTLNMQWRLGLADQPEFTGQGRSRGNLDKLALQQQISGPLQLGLEVEARDLLSQLRWQARADVSEVNLARLNTAWPAIRGELQVQGEGDRHSASLSGQLSGEYPEQGPFEAETTLQVARDGALEIEQLSMRSPPTKTEVNARGQWTPGSDGFKSGELALAFDWENLRWPLAGNAWIDSAEGEGRVEGTPDHYRLSLRADRPLPQAPPSTWHANASGDLEGLDLDSLRITALDGETILSGRLDWSPRLAWDVDASGKAINPAGLWPQWPGRLDARLSSTGYIEEGEVIAEADIARVSGELRGQPVTLRSQLGWQRAQLEVKQFELKSGSAKVDAQGTLGERMNLDWSIDAAELAQLYPQAGGQLQASGHISGTRAEPVIRTTFNGEQLSLSDYRIGKLSGRLGVDLFRWQQIDIDLAAQELGIHEQRIDTLAINADPGGLQLTAEADGNSARIALKGEANAEGWRGQIEAIDLQGENTGNWQLQRPVALNLTRDNLSVAPFCVQSETASLCGQLQQTGKNWRSELELVNFPLQLFSPWLPGGLVIEGVTHADATFELDSPGQLSGRAHVELPAGAVVYPVLEGESERWEYRTGNLDLSVDEKGVRATSRLAMDNGDQLEARLALPGAQLLNLERDSQPVQGSASVTINQPGIIEALLPDVQDLDGKLAMQLDVDGTLAKPHYNGKASLDQGSLRIPRLGLQLTQIRVDARSEGLDRLGYELAARSGDGDMRVEGETVLDNRAGWPTSISLKGENFEVARIPEARVAVTPDLRLELEGRSIDISGKVHVPYARLQPKDVTTAAQVSEDAVIVGGEEVDEKKWQISSRVRVTLGDRVSVYGFGFEGRLGGDLLLMDSPGELTTATGEIHVIEGRYTAYGQRLTVEHGRLLYTGGPVNNPGLDLRAVRYVNDVTAGIRVRGTLNHPDVELFSIPVMGQTDVLAYLMLGRPLETATGEEGSMMARAALALSLSGGDSLARQIGDRFGLDEMRVEASDSGEQASLVMGRYLAPKLYVSYGVGIIQSFNTFTVRYQLSDHWYIKGESGEHQSADILYTIDR
ncbi:translocation/assembly module TamB domain-containing protein [Thiohalophilus thiocyanatoxydans]|uniref:Translocation and assembly module TamB n=1 Tax=Thiohalophilus thiocyanatoxydans TaxID=381308 RepID=A0A4R8IF04_9GAMM|nr:translocation/assembly module TamB domain-containing protein [Thiohalophilus thiocyanatoxydans]TDX98180.1 translocation and assembly module TamB [Thiohalophilus thiocyanatoxydans]